MMDSLSPPPATVKSILESVASYYGVNVRELRGKRRFKSIAEPRAMAMYLARQHTTQSYPDLGRAFGHKHHTTVITAIKKVETRLKKNPAVRGEVAAIEGVLLGR